MTAATAEPAVTAAPASEPGVGARVAAGALVVAQGVLLVVVARARSPRSAAAPRWARAASALGQASGAAVAAVAGAGLGSGLTASPLPNQHARLQTGGLYRLVRHPIYSGVLLASGTRAAASRDRRALAAFAGLVVVLRVKTGLEERHLAQRFPEYADYAPTVGRLLPTVRRGEDGGGSRLPRRRQPA